MPYIKQEDRHPFDSAIKALRNNQYGTATMIVLDALKVKDKTQFEGCLNYLITQLIRSEVIISEEIELWIRSLIEGIYIIIGKKYFRYKNGSGLIHTIATELIRRNWDTEANIGFLDSLQAYLDKIYGDYEDKKREENGDLEEVN